MVEFHFLHVAVQISQHHQLKRLLLLHFMLLPLCQILTDHRDMGLLRGFLFCSIGLCVCSYASTRLFWLQWPCNTVWYQVLWSLLLCSSFSKLQQLFRVIYGSMKFFIFYLEWSDHFYFLTSNLILSINFLIKIIIVFWV